MSLAAFCFALLHPTFPPAMFAAGLAALTVSSWGAAFFSLRKVSVRRGSNNDGTLKRAAGAELFRQFDDGVPTEELGLPPVKVDTWGGWLWFNMDLAVSVWPAGSPAGAPG